MNCDCYERINAELKDKGLRLCGHENVTPEYHPGVAIRTEWLQPALHPGMAPIPMFGSHCPFCGAPLEPKEPETTLTTTAKPGDPVVWVNMNHLLKTVDDNVVRMQQMVTRLTDSQVADVLDVVIATLDEIHNALTEIQTKIEDVCLNGKTPPVTPKAAAENPEPGPATSSTTG